MPSSHARRMNLVALALLITALLAFAAFHFLVVVYSTAFGEPHELGWRYWPVLFELLQSADATEPRVMIASASFLSAALVVTLSPFLLPFLRKSRPGWWVVVLSSGAATCGFGGIALTGVTDGDLDGYGPALPCLLAAFALNLIGLLFIRREGELSS
jgi:hypothetical protein